MSDEKCSAVIANSWEALRRFTPARIALGRSGSSLPTLPHLQFQLAHARARSAVHHRLDVAKLQSALAGLFSDVLDLHSAAESRSVYLQRPDLGRTLDEKSRKLLSDRRSRSGKGCDIALVVGDGLSALAIEEHAVPFLKVLAPAMTARDWKIGPVSIVSEARVAVGDEVGEALDARLVAVLIGERPGLSSPDSMGIYLTFAPRPGLTDEARNCISNVRTEGLSYDQAVHKLTYLIGEALRRGLTGVRLKDEAEALPPAPDQGDDRSVPHVPDGS